MEKEPDDGFEVDVPDSQDNPAGGKGLPSDGDAGEAAQAEGAEGAELNQADGEEYQADEEESPELARNKLMRARADKRRLQRERDKSNRLLAQYAEQLQILTQKVEGLTNERRNEARERAEYALRSTEASINETAKALVKAIADGDISEAQRLKQLETELLLTKLQLQSDVQGGNRAPAPASREAGQPPTAQRLNQRRAQQLARSWMDKNTWFDEEGEDDKSAFALTLSRRVAESGIPIDDPEHYVEVS